MSSDIVCTANYNRTWLYVRHLSLFLHYKMCILKAVWSEIRAKMVQVCSLVAETDALVINAIFKIAKRHLQLILVVVEYELWDI